MVIKRKKIGIPEKGTERLNARSRGWDKRRKILSDQSDLQEEEKSTSWLRSGRGGAPYQSREKNKITEKDQPEGENSHKREKKTQNSQHGNRTKQTQRVTKKNSHMTVKQRLD